MARRQVIVMADILVDEDEVDHVEQDFRAMIEKSYGVRSEARVTTTVTSYTPEFEVDYSLYPPGHAPGTPM
jgi:hypothetical protein